jgi:hypothetical protein
MSTLAAPPYVAPILTQTLDEFVQQQVAEQGFVDESEYFSNLAEKERKEKIRDYYGSVCPLVACLSGGVS